MELSDVANKPVVPALIWPEYIKLFVPGWVVIPVVAVSLAAVVAELAVDALPVHEPDDPLVFAALFGISAEAKP